MLLTICSLFFPEKSDAETPSLSVAEKDYQSAVEYAYGMNKVRMDDTKVIEFLRRAAAQGLPEAEVSLAYVTNEGFFGLTKDSAKAVELARQALAHGLIARANDGKATAQVALARLYREGLGLEKDMSKAAEFYQKAADQGNASAQNALGLFYIGVNGDISGLKKDAKKAVELIRRAADQGDATAQFNLALLYESGEGVDKDLNKAIELYRKSSTQGNEDATATLRRLGK